MRHGWKRAVVAVTAAICAVAMWGCERESGTERARKKNFAEYMRVVVRDPSRMRIEWRYSTLRKDGQTLIGLVVFWTVNGYGGYELPTYYHVAVRSDDRVYFRETESPDEMRRKPESEEAYLAREKKTLEIHLDSYFYDVEQKLRELEKMKVPDLPADLEGGDWSDTRQKRGVWERYKSNFDAAQKNERTCAAEVEDALAEALQDYSKWEHSQEGRYYSLGLVWDISVDAREKSLAERASAAQSTYREAWLAGMARLSRMEERLKAAEKDAESAKARAKYGALTAAKAREAAAAQEMAATAEEAQRWHAAAEEKMRSFEEYAVQFYAENHPAGASKYEIEDYRKFAAQLLLGIHRTMGAMAEKQEALSRGADGAEREGLEREIAASERRIDEFWQTLLVGIGVKKHTLQLERQSGRPLPRMKKTAVPFVPGSPTFLRYEPYLRELAGESR